MAQVDRNSTAIADMVATPRVPVNPSKGAAGQLFEAAGYVANAADDSQNSVHRFCRVPSNARISQVLLTTGDASSAGACDIGIYQTVDNGSAVVDSDLFASAFALTGGPFENTDVTYESDEYTEAESVKPLWEVLGLSADPCREYDVAAKITTTYNGAAVGQLLKVRYVI
jgi:hypothetical protein